MEVPGLFEIRLVPKFSSDVRIQYGKLAMEILCASDAYKHSCPTPESRKVIQCISVVPERRCISEASIIRVHGMHNFLVQVSTVMWMFDSQVAIEQGNCIKFLMATEFCEFPPEIEDHFEIFEYIGGFNVIVTSASSKEELLFAQR